jgi:phosphoribosylformylglycinamidine synthase
MTRAVHRIEVRPRAGLVDPRGAAACRQVQALGVEPRPARVDSAAVYLLEGELSEAQLRRLARELLADPVTESATMGAEPLPADAALIEVHPLPGVMDPDAEAVESAAAALLGTPVRVRTGRRYDIHGMDQRTARLMAERCLANPVIHAIHDRPHLPQSFPAGTRYRYRPTPIVIEDMDEAALRRFSRDAHLFLSTREMQAIQAEYRRLGRDPQEIELETIAQTWSEHCVHKTLRSTIRYRQNDGSVPPGLDAARAATRAGHEPGDDGSITIRNLLRSTIVAATEALASEGLDWCLSVFSDNSGVVGFDDEYAVCFKVETHNHPSAIEPYGGAATGIGGCIRDIIGTGLAARPVAATDVFCVAHPGRWMPRRHAPTEVRLRDAGPVLASIGPAAATEPAASRRELPEGCIHPRRVLQEVVAGVRDYGNRMGIPTLNGAVWFDDDYVGNPLVFCGCVGLLPRGMVRGAACHGDRIVVLGGRTGRDGIHGATFSSAELTGTHADEFSHAVQIGNALTQKKLLDAVLAAREHAQGPLYSAITDCGAGGFSSAVGEMGRKLGAEVHLERAGLKYEGLSPTEIWISEAQERMVLAVPPESMDALREICRLHEVEMFELGRFGTEDRMLLLHFGREEVGRLSMDFLHEGRPDVQRLAFWSPRRTPPPPGRRPPGSVGESLHALLAHPNIASKRWIIRQYDHEVQGGSVIKPLAGPGEGPSDAAVIAPVEDSTRGVAIASGLATLLRDDPYLMALGAIDECVRNLICVGADPRQVALLDNFCWPGCQDERRLGELVRAAEGCYDGSIAYRAPFISGKDSLNNQFTTTDGRTIEVPPTLLVSGLGIVGDVYRCVTMDAKAPGNLLVYLGPPTRGLLRGSHYALLVETGPGDDELPAVDLEAGPLAARAAARLIELGLVRSAHDCSDGGLLVAATEMALGGELGLQLRWADIPAGERPGAPMAARLFCEEPSRYLLEIEPRRLGEARSALEAVGAGVAFAPIGTFDDSGRLRLVGADAGEAPSLDLRLEELRGAWTGTLDW